MKTRCPDCQTTFRVTPEQLKARAGKVRCGQCQHVFNALDSLVDEVVVSSPALVEPSAAVSLEALQSAQPARPADETPVAETATETTAAAPTPPAETDASLRVLLEPAPEGAPSAVPDRERIAPGAETPVDPLSETEVQELGKATGLILPREMTEVPGYSKWSVGVMAASIDHAPEKPARWPYVLVAGVFSLALLGQIAFRFRSELAITVPAARPALEALSQALNTDIPLPRHVELVSIEASDLQSDAARGNLLALNATVRNRAAYPQAYPALELALTDTQDTPIVRRVFRPEEYLPATLRADQPFPAHSDIAIRLWIEAKDVSAAGYRIYVFYP